MPRRPKRRWPKPRVRGTVAAGRHACDASTWSPSTRGTAAWTRATPACSFPAGMKEKDVTLQMSLLLREELRARGITVRMTRTRDTLIALGDRGAYCTEDCDLFVSLHVNSLPRRRGYTDVRGYETFFLAEAKTEDAERVAKMENEAVRFEPETEATAEQQGLDFILKDLATNEYLRESARLAELIQVAARQRQSGRRPGREAGRVHGAHHRAPAGRAGGDGLQHQPRGRAPPHQQGIAAAHGVGDRRCRGRVPRGL